MSGIGPTYYASSGAEPCSVESPLRRVWAVDPLSPQPATRIVAQPRPVFPGFFLYLFNFNYFEMRRMWGARTRTQDRGRIQTSRNLARNRSTVTEYRNGCSPYCGNYASVSHLTP